VREQEIPDAARVAVPGSIAACALAHAGDGRLSLSRLVRHGVEIARDAGAKGRATALERIARSGAAGLRALARPLVAVAGRSEGGVLSEDDLAGVRPASARPLEIGSGKSRRTIWIVPWPAPAGEQRRHQIIVAADVRGVVCVLSWAADEHGVAIPDLELTAPRDAVAVRRGVPRVRPGEPLPCPAPIAIAGDRGVAVIALGVPRSEALDARRMAEAWQMPNTAALDLVPEGGIGVVRSLEAEDARPLRRAPR
jgi:gamma-glutamyltranspeptidase/glutathione hydrolase